MWNAFAAVTGGAATGLIALTFIVVAFRFDKLAIRQVHRSRAAQTLTFFVAVTVLSALITVPQPDAMLGFEMVAVALLTVLTLIMLDASAMRDGGIPASPWTIAGAMIFAMLLSMSGLVLCVGYPWGMYLYVPSAVVALISGIDGAWGLLTRTDMNVEA